MPYEITCLYGHPLMPRELRVQNQFSPERCLTCGATGRKWTRIPEPFAAWLRLQIQRRALQLWLAANCSIDKLRQR